ncbi:hypothetical protein [Collimonas silvisoli]|uniref:hypothetical protein n=1 Tax=Collimonas silvisoli TaxID=2825884 RepID=UPI001B8AD34B|nr:hypothetical protein [Collimonas silvisoli]
MKRALCSMVLLVFITSATATSFVGLTHEIHFEKNSDHIPASEVRAIVDWKIEKQRDFGDGEYDIGTTINKRLNVTRDLAERRAKAIKSLMQSLGVHLDDVGSLEDKSSLTTQQEADTAYVMFQPPCTKTHDCGPQPINPR